MSQITHKRTFSEMESINPSSSSEDMTSTSPSFPLTLAWLEQNMDTTSTKDIFHVLSQIPFDPECHQIQEKITEQQVKEKFNQLIIPTGDEDMIQLSSEHPLHFLMEAFCPHIIKQSPSLHVTDLQTSLHTLQMAFNIMTQESQLQIQAAPSSDALPPPLEPISQIPSTESDDMPPLLESQSPLLLGRTVDQHFAQIQSQVPILHLLFPPQDDQNEPPNEPNSNSS